ncbi:MAG: hypothetical protein M1823_002948 [Watsoniomyces obsoletus]|nr:MAG: hypothetical protein M1823_002948 [Watsoniomyces obsoletus]
MRISNFSWVLSLLLASLPLIRCAQHYVSGRAFDRFITIWLENQDFSNARENPDIQELAKSGVTLTSYYGLTHPSQPNYIASVGGDYFGLDHDGVVRVPENVSTVVDLFETRKIDWRVYMEDQPGPGFMAQGSTDEDGKWKYVRKHNPLISFRSIINNGSRLLNLVSFDDFERDLRDKQLPQYAHMSPNMLNDGHNTTLAYATKWTREFLEPLLRNEYFMSKTLVLLTYDESETYTKPNRVLSLLLGGAIPDNKRGTADDTFYTHYSILSTLENNWELPNLGRYDVGANVFDFVARKTGYRNQAMNMSLVDLSVSYPGVLNSRQPTEKVQPPNPFLKGPGGKGIVPTMPEYLRKPKNGEVMTPYDGSGKVPDGALSPPVAVLRTAASSTGYRVGPIRLSLEAAFGCLFAVVLGLVL